MEFVKIILSPFPIVSSISMFDEQFHNVCRVTTVSRGFPGREPKLEMLSAIDEETRRAIVALLGAQCSFNDICTLATVGQRGIETDGNSARPKLWKFERVHHKGAVHRALCNAHRGVDIWDIIVSIFWGIARTALS